MIKKPKKVCTVLNYMEHLLILASATIGCVYISAFASLVSIQLEILSSAVGTTTCAITAEIKTYKSIIKKKKKNYVKIILLVKLS